jgi:hypothetical protein
MRSLISVGGSQQNTLHMDIPLLLQESHDNARLDDERCSPAWRVQGDAWAHRGSPPDGSSGANSLAHCGNSDTRTPFCGGVVGDAGRAAIRSSS